MKVKVKDKRIKLVMTTVPGDQVKGLQPNEVERIRFRVDVLIDAETLKQVADAFPQWRVHKWKGKVQWSIDVLGNTRLLFDYEGKTHEVSAMIYDDPH